MTNAKQIYTALDRIIPFSSREEWDNSGLLLDCKNDSGAVMVCLDVTSRAVRAAADRQAGIIVSHHPLIFSPLKKIEAGEPVFELIKNNISVISAHTNFDKYPMGTGRCMASELGLGEIRFRDDGICLSGRLPQDMTAARLAGVCRDKFGAAEYTCAEKNVSRVFICPGSGGGLVSDVLDSGADCFVTGECSYHNRLDLREKGVSVITVGHDRSERISLGTLAALVKKCCGDAQVSVYTRDLLCKKE